MVISPDFVFEYNIFNPELAQLVLNALIALKKAPLKDIYTNDDIPGLGSNFMRASTLQNAINSYEKYLEHFGITGAMEILEKQTLKNIKRSTLTNVKRIFQGDLLKDIYELVEFPQKTSALVRRHRTLERQWQEQIKISQERDAIKGREIFSDYDATRPPQTDFIQWCKDRYERERKRCNTMLNALKLTRKND